MAIIGGIPHFQTYPVVFSIFMVWFMAGWLGFYELLWLWQLHGWADHDLVMWSDTPFLLDLQHGNGDLLKWGTMGDPKTIQLVSSISTFFTEIPSTSPHHHDSPRHGDAKKLLERWSVYIGSPLLYCYAQRDSSRESPGTSRQKRQSKKNTREAVNCSYKQKLGRRTKSDFDRNLGHGSPIEFVWVSDFELNITEFLEVHLGWAKILILSRCASHPMAVPMSNSSPPGLKDSRCHAYTEMFGNCWEHLTRVSRFNWNGCWWVDGCWWVLSLEDDQILQILQLQASSYEIHHCVPHAIERSGSILRCY